MYYLLSHVNCDRFINYYLIAIDTITCVVILTATNCGCNLLVSLWKFKPQMMDDELNQKVEEWLKWDQYSPTRKELQEMVTEGDTDNLRSCLMSRLSFGTAGIRGKMRTGFNGMNDLVIIQTTQGLCTYLIDTYGYEVVREKGVVIGFDSRHNSSRFARRASTVFLSKGIKVYLFGSDHLKNCSNGKSIAASDDESIPDHPWSLKPKETPTTYHASIVATPFVPFGVLFYKSIAGIMITASHNPKEDNGYKVYFQNGSQIISPHDVGIQKMIISNLEPWTGVWEDELIAQSLNCGLLVDSYQVIYTEYFKQVKNQVFDEESIKKSGLKVTFTALHGVGHKFLLEALGVLGLRTGFNTCNVSGHDCSGKNDVQVFPVQEQMVPDADFPTVTFPNPEEGSGVLDLSLKTANETSSDIILANDPDADRVALAERLPRDESHGKKGGEWKIFNGNEIGALLGYWTWFTFKERMDKIYGADKKKWPINPANDVYMMSSAVSSDILKSMASKEGFNFIETLTGFKWMGNISDDLLKNGANKTILFCFEEAIGFMVANPGQYSVTPTCPNGGSNGVHASDGDYKPMLLDKDGITAGVELASMASYLKYHHKRTLLDQLNVIYDMYGYHKTMSSYFICHKKDVIRKIFEDLKDEASASGYIDKIGKFNVSRVRDLHKPGYDSSTKDNVPTLPTSSSYMITFYFGEENMKVTLRTSGTEPKVKYYSEIVGKPGQTNHGDLDETLNLLIKHVINDCFKPKINGLIERSD